MHSQDYPPTQRDPMGGCHLHMQCLLPGTPATGERQWLPAPSIEPSLSPTGALRSHSPCPSSPEQLSSTSPGPQAQGLQPGPCVPSPAHLVPAVPQEHRTAHLCGVRARSAWRGLQRLLVGEWPLPGLLARLWFLIFKPKGVNLILFIYVYETLQFSVLTRNNSWALHKLLIMKNCALYQL